jgi:hypothetical protein
MEEFNVTAGVASIFGLVFSVLAFIQARRAHTAARQARDAVTFRVVADELELACVRAEQLVDFLEHSRFDEAALRVAELTSSLSELPNRRGSYLDERHRNKLMNAREQLASVGVAVKSPNRRRSTSDADSKRPAVIARQVMMTLREIVGTVKSRIDEGTD